MIETTVKIGRDTVDINKPADVVIALKKVELTVAAGAKAETVEIAGEKVTYTRANIGSLRALIREYEAKAAALAGRGRNSRSRRVRWI